MRVLSPLALAILCSTVLAGCAGSPVAQQPDELVPDLDVTASTGGIRGIVVDQAIVPIAGARIVLTGGAEAASDSEGVFTFTGLQPGDYFLSVSKAAYTSAQQSVTVVAGVANPPLAKILLERLTTAQPYLDFYKLDGFYECGFALPFITDSCDFGWRTAYDEVNHTGGQPPPFIPRSPTGSSNTQYIDVSIDTWSIIQEGYWDDPAVSAFWIMVSSTPIDNACDCSDKDYVDTEGPMPLLGRLDLYDEATRKAREPAGHTVAARGFLPFGDPQSALSFRFTVITSLFHNYAAPEGWTFETKDQYPVG